MRKICFSYNHFQFADGVARSAIAMANHLCIIDDVEVTLRPIFKMEKAALALANPKVKVKPVIGFYIKGLSLIIHVLPDRLLHKLIFEDDHYDIEIGFQYGVATRAVVSTQNKSAKHYVWMHGYDTELIMEKYYKLADIIVCVSKFNAGRLKKSLMLTFPLNTVITLLTRKR